MLGNVQESAISCRVLALLVFLPGLGQSRDQCSALSPETVDGVVSGLFTNHLQYRPNDND